MLLAVEWKEGENYRVFQLGPTLLCIYCGTGRRRFPEGCALVDRLHPTLKTGTVLRQRQDVGRLVSLATRYRVQYGHPVAPESIKMVTTPPRPPGTVHPEMGPGGTFAETTISPRHHTDHPRTHKHQHTRGTYAIFTCFPRDGVVARCLAPNICRRPQTGALWQLADPPLPPILVCRGRNRLEAAPPPRSSSPMSGPMSSPIHGGSRGHGHGRRSGGGDITAP